jgi:hypothetical protein
MKKTPKQKSPSPVDVTSFLPPSENSLNRLQGVDLESCCLSARTIGC